MVLFNNKKNQNQNQFPSYQPFFSGDDGGTQLFVFALASTVTGNPSFPKSCIRPCSQHLDYFLFNHIIKGDRKYTKAKRRHPVGFHCASKTCYHGFLRRLPQAFYSHRLAPTFTTFRGRQPTRNEGHCMIKTYNSPHNIHSPWEPRIVGPLMGAPMLPVDFKKWQCPLSLLSLLF